MVSAEELIRGQRDRRQLKQLLRVEAESSRSQLYAIVAGYDGTTGQWLARVRGGVAQPARVLRPTNLEIGEVVSASQDISGTLWIDKL